jgi:hypothetical protein
MERVCTLSHQLPQQPSWIESRRVGPVHSAKPLQDSRDQFTAKNCFKVGSTDGQPWQDSQTTEQSSGRVVSDRRTILLAHVAHQHVPQSPDVGVVQMIDVGQAVLLDTTTAVGVVVDA